MCAEGIGSILGAMQRPRLLIAAAPYVYATALAARFRAEAAYDVTVLDLAAGEPVPLAVYDAAISDGTDVFADVVLTLPASSYDEPVIVTVAGVAVPIPVDPAAPIAGLVEILGRYVTPPADRRSPLPR
jgi:hypothetical protein